MNCRAKVKTIVITALISAFVTVCIGATLFDAAFPDVAEQIKKDYIEYEQQQQYRLMREGIAPEAYEANI